MSAYEPHETLIAPARSSAALWRLVIGIAVLVMTFVVLNTLWFGMVRRLPDAAEIFHEIRQGDTVRGMALLLGSFVSLLGALLVAVRLVHGRGVIGLTGPVRTMLGQFARVSRAVAVLFLLLFLVPLPADLEPERAMGLGRWLALVPLSLGLLLLQTGAEELVFRGYLQSQLAARFRHPAIWIGAPSLVFGLLHYDPATYGDAAIWPVVWAFLFGVVAGDLTARAGSLGPALALHLVNNFAAIGLTAMDGYWDGLALYTLPVGPGDSAALVRLMPIEGGILLCAWLAARVALRR